MRQLVTLTAHAGVCGACATGMSLVGSELYPGHPGLVLGLVLITAGAIDLGSDKGRAWLLARVTTLWRLMQTGVRASLEEMSRKPRAGDSARDQPDGEGEE